MRQIREKFNCKMKKDELASGKWQLQTSLSSACLPKLRLFFMSYLPCVVIILTRKKAVLGL